MKDGEYEIGDAVRILPVSTVSRALAGLVARIDSCRENGVGMPYWVVRLADDTVTAIFPGEFEFVPNAITVYVVWNVWHERLIGVFDTPKAAKEAGEEFALRYLQQGMEPWIYRIIPDMMEVSKEMSMT